jgi:hypothetical protein
MPHTPGPWTVEDPMGPDTLWIVEAGKRAYEWRCIAAVSIDDGTGEELPPQPRIGTAMRNANACLIATAPELLSIAKRWAALDGGAWNVERHAAEKAKLIQDTQTAIAKATAGTD